MVQQGLRAAEMKGVAPGEGVETILLRVARPGVVGEGVAVAPVAPVAAGRPVVGQAKVGAGPTEADPSEAKAEAGVARRQGHDLREIEVAALTAVPLAAAAPVTDPVQGRKAVGDTLPGSEEGPGGAPAASVVRVVPWCRPPTTAQTSPVVRPVRAPFIEAGAETPSASFPVTIH